MEKCQDTDKETMAGKIIFEKEEIGKVKDMLEGMWRSRERQIKQKEEESSKGKEKKGGTANNAEESGPNGLNLLTELPRLSKYMGQGQ